MKFLIVFVALFAVALAAPADQTTTIERQETDVSPEGYKAILETSDGTRVESSGQLKTISPKEAAVVSSGSYSYYDDNGAHHVVNWVADENGFHPEGADIPVAPVA